MIVQRQNSAYDRAGSTSTGGMDGCPLFVVSSNQEGACRRMRSEHNRFSLPAAWSALAGAMFVFCAGAADAGAAGAVPVLSEPEPGGQPGAAACGAGGRGAAFVGPGSAGGGGRAARRQRGPVAHAGAVCGGAGGAAGGGALRLVQDGLGHRQCLHHGRGTGPRTGPHRHGLFPPVPQQRAPDHPAGRPHVGGRQAGARGAVCGAALPGRGAFEPDGIFHGALCPAHHPKPLGKGICRGGLHPLDRPLALCCSTLTPIRGPCCFPCWRSTRG